MDKYFVDSSLCTSAAIQPTPLAFYSPTRGAPPPVQVQGTQLIVSYPAPITQSYYYEGTRYNASKCSFCPYSGYPETLYPEYLLAGGVRMLPTPMYGPCLDGMQSIRTACTQNLILYPPEFVGEYFFPEQKLIPNAFPNFAHKFIEGSYPSSKTNVDSGTLSQISPSMYGLGRQFALNHLGTFQVFTNGVLNTTLSQQLQAPYLTDSQGKEQWPKWEQHFCRPACHRDSQYQVVLVRPSDYEGKSPTLAYLKRSSAPLNLEKCNKCPPYQAAYNWGAVINGGFDNPANPSENVQAVDCFPWFGSVPVVIPRYSSPPYYQMNRTTVIHSETLDGVVWPPSNSYVQGVPCPQNTYNDVCAHTLLMNVSSSSSSMQPQCKPCPPGGFHTDGQGAWFCLPPPGQTAYIPDPINSPLQSPLRNLLNVYKDANGSSLLWARRDILGYEFECGYKPEHCYQCAAAGLPQDALPDDFNRQVILKNILIWQPCPSGFYCPTALQPPVQCPAALPWSPPGSYAQSQCACKRGTYYSSSAGGCQPCLERTACPVGQFMSGWTLCTQSDGATSGGECTPCTNMPKANATYLPSYFGPGIEILNPTNGRYYGFCPFVCDDGTLLVLGSSTSTMVCLSSYYTCSKVNGWVTNSESTPVYSAATLGLRDGLVLPSSGQSCMMQRNLSNALNDAKKATSSSAIWLRVAASCAEVNASACSGASACFVTRNATYSNNFECAPCPTPNSGVFYNSANGILSSYTCAAMCQLPAHYYNATSQNCSSCAALEQAYCPQGRHIQGQGCYGDFTPFPTLSPEPLAAANCILCSLPLPTEQNRWLNLQDPSGCSQQLCSKYDPQILGVTSYIAVPCGQTSDTVLKPCTLTCPKGNFLQGSCTASTTGVCRQCSSSLPGSYIQTNCTANADTAWSLCSVPGTYCPGDGSVAQCPNNQTSNPGASSILDCYCPAGTRAGEFGTCIAYRCQDAALGHTLGPGAGYVSSYYMALNPTSRTTECVKCPAGSFSYSGHSYFNGVGIESCRCPTNSIMMMMQGANSTNNCVPCSTSSGYYCTATAMGAYSGVPDVCWQGGVAANCQCLPPPFTALSPGDTSSKCAPSPTKMCLPGFEYYNAGSDTSSPTLETVTGSSLYATRQQAWKWTSFAASKFSNPKIKSLKTTSDLGGWGDPANWQFVVWTVQEPSLTYVFAAPMNALSSSSSANYNPYQYTSIAWPITSGDSIADIAVAQWPSPQTTISSSSVSTQVAALVLSGATTAKLAINSLQVNPEGGAPKWGAPDAALLVSLGDVSSAVCMGHAYLPQGTFFVATNNSNILAVVGGGGGGFTTLTLTGPLSAAAFMASPLKDGTVWIYVWYARTTTIKLLKKWNPAAGSSSSVPQDETDELYFPPSIESISSLSVAWPDVSLLTPVFIALARKSTQAPPSPQQNALFPQGQPMTVVAADLTQRTLTEIQDLLPVHPSTLASIPMGVGSLMLVASDNYDDNDQATTTNLYSTVLPMCVPYNNIPRFWDGQRCRSHTCIRSRPCATNAGQVWSPVSMTCQCVPGYYNNNPLGALQCILCPAGSFCAGGNATARVQSCPFGMTSYPGSQSQQQCTCRDSSFYNYAAKACQPCPGGSWCPNRWSAIPCPGAADTTRSVAGSQYPKGCICAPGSVGASCASCPGDNMHCPAAGSSAVVNSVAMANVVWLSPTDNITSSVCDILLPIVSSFLAGTNIWYLQQVSGGHFYCEYVPSPSSFISPMVAIMVQTETADAANSLVKALPVVLSLNSTAVIASRTGGFVLNGVQPVSFISSPGTVFNNTAIACPSGKVPSLEKTACVCAQGYETSGVQCSACAANYYKPGVGTGVCIICPTGSFSSPASASCTSGNNGTLAAASSSSAGPNVGMIVGLALGGTVVVGLVVWAAISQPAASGGYSRV